jgi:hypothetical protein
VVDRQSGTAIWRVEPCLSTEARIIIAALHLSPEKAKADATSTSSASSKSFSGAPATPNMTTFSQQG